MILIWRPFILIILLILSIFFETFWKVLFSRYLPPTTTNVQKVWSIMTFSLSVVDFPPIKSKFIIFSRSCSVWVKGSKRVTSSFRVILHTWSWYVNNLFNIWLKSLKRRWLLFDNNQPSTDPESLGQALQLCFSDHLYFLQTLPCPKLILKCTLRLILKVCWYWEIGKLNPLSIKGHPLSIRFMKISRWLSLSE